MAIMTRFTQEDLDEVFPYPVLREVAFEIRFSPRLRVDAELWRLQDQLADEYPSVGTESAATPAGSLLAINVFKNNLSGRIIKVSHENFVVAFTQYSRFEDFKTEVLAKASAFCSTFGVSALNRVGLRYVNDIVLPTEPDGNSLLRFVRPLMDFQRLPIDSVEQFVNEVHLRHSDHRVTLRGVLLSPMDDSRRVYVLDIDCHSPTSQPASALAGVLDKFHDSAQKFFLDHITEQLKQVMRGKS
ncbi:hypothetical protein SBA4_1010032 [Candidatus Sulfopaludibacter sp. SbA4]|nr:hypothetical protein SBA4_1010032 [Candidatus Sulfopaludibacter sp. SbA4]